MVSKTLLFAPIAIVFSIYLYKIWHEKCIDSKLNEIKLKADQEKLTIGQDIPINQFKIDFNQSEWDNLKSKIASTRYFNPLDSNDVQKFEFGFDVDYAKELADYWKDKFNWKQQVDHLNKFPHFKFEFNGFNIHFMRVNTYSTIDKSSRSEKIPILLLDGWPGSFSGFFKAIDYLNSLNNKERHFDIVVPSIPGYGYSVPLTKPVDVFETARLNDALMRKLFGDDVEYFIHGEDWGSLIATVMAKFYPQRVSGIHLSFASTILSFDVFKISTMLALGVFPQYMLTKEELESNFKLSFSERILKIARETGYMHIQATKPDSLGFGLTDSPVGLMAYILEKYSSWSFNYEKEILGRRDGSLNEFKRDDLLTIVTHYWMTNSITSSMRYYKFGFNTVFIENAKKLMESRVPGEVAVGFINMLNEPVKSPLALLELSYGKILHYTVSKNGGHFASFHEPEIVMSAFIKFIDKAQQRKVRSKA